MKQLIILTLFCFPLSILAQETLKNRQINVPTDTNSHCARMIREGDEYFKKKQFEKAINAYTAAQVCNRERTTQVNENIARVFNELNQQKDKAINAERKARKGEKEAINAERKARRGEEEAMDAKNEAIKQKENAENSERIANVALKKLEEGKKKAEKEQKISEWSAYAAAQSVTNANHAWYLAEKGCEQSHYINPMAVSLRAQLWADYNKLYYKQSFFHPLSKSVTAMAVSPNERFMLAGFSDGSVKMWSIQTGELYFEYPKFSQPIRAVAVSDRGTVAIVSNSTKRDAIRDTLFIYAYNDLSKGISLTFGAATAMNCISISKDGHYLVLGTSSYSDDALLIDLEAINKKLDIQSKVSLNDYVTPLTGHTNQILTTDFSPDNNYVATASEDKTVLIYDIKGKAQFSLKGHTAVVNGVSFSDDGLFIATASDDKTIRLWDAKNGQFISTFKGHHDGVKSVAFVPNSEYLVSFASKEVFVWNRNGQMIHKLEELSNLVYAVAAVSSHSNSFFTGDEYGVIRQWVIDNKTQKIDVKSQEGVVEAVAYSQNGRLIATGAMDKKIKLWGRDGQLLRTFEGHFGNIKSLDFSQDNRYLLSSTDDNEVRLWRVEGPPVGVFEGHKGSVSQALFMPDGQHILTGSSDSTARIWTFDGKEEGKLFDARFPTRITTVACSPDGQTIYTGGDNNLVAVWKKKGDIWRVADTFRYALLGNMCIKVSKNGQYLAIAGGKDVEVWHLKTRKKRRFESKFISYSVDFDPLSNSLVVAGDTLHGYIWDLKTDSLTLSFIHRGITNALFSPDGQAVLTCGGMGDAQLTHIDGTTQIVYGHNSTDVQYVFCNEKDGSFATIDRYDVIFWDSSGFFLNKWHRNDKEIVSASYSKDVNELCVLQEDGTLTKLDALKHQRIEERSLNSPFKSAVLSPDGTKIFAERSDSFALLQLGTEKGFNVGNIKKMAWVNNDYLYGIHSDKIAVSLIPFNDNSKLKTFFIPDIRPICAAVSPNAHIIVAGEEEDGWLYLYKTSESKLMDSVKTETGIKKIEFIDNQHFLTLHLDGKTQLHAIVEVDSNHLQISSTLQTLDKSSGIWGYDAYRHRLVLADRHCFAMNHIAAIGQKPITMDTIWWHEKLAYNLPVNEFDVIEKCKINPNNHRRELSSLAMMKRIKSTNDHYFKKSVNLIAAIRYATAADDNVLSQVFSDELDSVEVKLKDRIYENNLLFSSCLENLNQYKNDAYELDTLYNRYDPDPIYRSQASDRYGSASYMAILTGAPSEGIKFAQRAMQIDASKTWAATNMALGYLYAGYQDSAYQVYTRFKEKYWKDSGYPRVRSTEKATFKDIFLAHIYDITENYFKKDTVAFAHLKKVNFEEVKIFLNNKDESYASADKSPQSKENSYFDNPKVSSEPLVQSKSIKRQLTKAEKFLLKQMRSGARGPIFREETATFLTNLEKEFSWNTDNAEIRAALAEGYFYKAWQGLFYKEFRASELSIIHSLFFDDQQYSAYAVLAHTQLFQGKLAEAKNNYTFYLEHSKKEPKKLNQILCSSGIQILSTPICVLSSRWLMKEAQKKWVTSEFLNMNGLLIIFIMLLFYFSNI